jgi:hypothetical protein
VRPDLLDLKLILRRPAGFAPAGFLRTPSKAGDQWPPIWLEMVDGPPLRGSTPFLPISDPFNGALKRLTQKANS